MRNIRSFEPGDRYGYDFDLWTCGRGWAQVDTAQDASWFGTWASPAERTILDFAEGDVSRTICDTDEELPAALREIDRWNRDHGYGPARIDPGFDSSRKAAFEAVGLGAFSRLCLPPWGTGDAAGVCEDRFAARSIARSSALGPSGGAGWASRVALAAYSI